MTISISNIKELSDSDNKLIPPEEIVPTDETLERWYRETCTIRNIVQFEKELGRPLTMFDLLCRFDRWEIDCVHDMLYWLGIEEVYA